MQPSSKRLAAHQLDQTLATFKGMAAVSAPKKGWIRAIRDALGMSARNLGVRVGVSQAAVAQIEVSEAEGKATIASMRKMAKALDCTFVYALVPNTSLNDTLKKQALLVARRQVSGAAHSMALEAQAVPDAQTQRQIEMLADEMLITRPRNMWVQDDA